MITFNETSKINFASSLIAQNNENYSNFSSEAKINDNYVFLSSLLPFSPMNQKKLDVGLLNYLFLMVSLEDAFKCIQNGDFEAFDSIVGENACQIRGIWIALKSHMCLENSKRVLAQIAKAKEIIQSLTPKLEFETRKKKTLQDLLNENKDLIVELTQDESYLLQTYILTLVKEVRDPVSPYLQRDNVVNHKKLFIFGILSRNCHNIVELFRKTLSADSAKFMREQALLINDPQLKKMVSEEYTVMTSSPKRTSISCFWSYKITTSIALNNRVPIVMRCWSRHANKIYKKEEGEKELMIFFQTSDGKSYKEFQPENTDHKRLALIVEGVALRVKEDFPSEEDWKKEILKHDIMDYMLVHSANHRQYVNDKEDYRIENADTKASFLFFKKKDKEIGCSLKNPKDFFLNHVYCSTIGNMIKKLNRKYQHVYHV